jgi:hypothetical protein
LALKLNRVNAYQTATIAVSGTTSDSIVLNGFSFGGIILPSTYDGTAMTFTVCDTEGGTYVALEDADGVAIPLVVEASKAYNLPPELFAFPFCKLVAGTSQSTTATEIVVCLKA